MQMLEDLRALESSPTKLANEVKAYLVLSEVYRGIITQLQSQSVAQSQAQAEQQAQMQAQAQAQMVEALNNAKAAQASMLRSPDQVAVQKKQMAEICHKLAQHHMDTGQEDEAYNILQEAVKHDETCTEAMLALAKMRLQRSEYDACQHQCMVLMRVDSGNEEASMIMADIMFRKGEYDAAIYHFQQILDTTPNNYDVLQRLVRLLRRAGRLEDTPKFLTAAEKSSARASFDAGLHYCKGLYQRFANSPREALQEFNLARGDAEWGTEAVYNMVEIYLNPEDDNMWEEPDNGRQQNSDSVHAATKLLSEAASHRGGVLDPKHKILEAYTNMATHQKPGIDKAMMQLQNLVSSDPNNVPCLLAMSTGFMMLKQQPKARNNLKRISKLPFREEETLEFEKCWLMLADIYSEGGKYDLAEELCKRCLSYNKSCAKAWEMMGVIKEKEQSYADAADNYEQAWKYTGDQSATIGFKLAFNYLKAKRMVEAIDVCHKVLAVNPDYPKIRTDILDKARQALKP